MVDFIQQIFAHWQELVAAALVVIGAFAALLGALYAFFLLIPGDQPDKFLKAMLDFTSKYSKK